MARKIEVYGIPQGEMDEQWLLALYVNPAIESNMTPAKDRICDVLSKSGCVVTSVRKVEVLEHEML